MKIRKAILADAKDIKSAWYHASQVNFRGYAPDNILEHLAFDDKAIQKQKELISNGEYYVAEEKDQVVGFANLRYPEKDAIEIGGLYIQPDFQRKGIGSALLEKICQTKKKLGYKKLILWTIKGGPSLGFYKKLGLKSSNMPDEKAGPFIATRLEKDL